MKTRETLEAIICTGKEALCGPLGYNERMEIMQSIHQAESELYWFEPVNRCPICGGKDCKNPNCGSKY